MKKLQLLLLSSLLVLLAGCSTRMGDLGTKTHFVFPNSNIEILGSVSESITKSSWILPPMFTTDEINELLRRARKKHQADLIVNYTVATEVTTYLWYSEITITLVGKAARMTVGNQKLLEDDILKKMEY